MKKHSKAKKFILYPILAIVFLAGVPYIVMLLWNNLMPDIVGARTINFWQALGLFILAKILFGFGGGGGKMRSCKKDRKYFMDMSPEERAEFKARMKERMCGEPATQTDPDNRQTGN